MKFKKNKANEGWTFMETLVVMAIVLVLTASVGLSSIKQIDKARVVTARTQIESFCVALDSFYMDTGRYPTENEGLDALWIKPFGLESGVLWNGPYVSKAIPQDPWGNSYVYEIPGNNGLAYSVLSYGKDGYKGGDDDSKDITSWQ